MRFQMRFQSDFKAISKRFQTGPNPSKMKGSSLAGVILLRFGARTPGFSILVFSNFYPTIYFGAFTALAMFIALVGSLTILPILLGYFNKNS